MKHKLGILIFTLLFASLAWPLDHAWDREDVDFIFSEIQTEIQNLQKKHQPSPAQEQNIMHALEVVFRADTPFMEIAQLGKFSGKKDEYLSRIANWQSVANYVLWGVCWLSDDESFDRQVVDDFHERFAPYRAFESMVRDYQFDRLKSYLGLIDENFVEEFTSQESLPALAKQAFQEVSLEIFSLYLQEEGLTTFEHWPKVMDFLPGSWAYQHLALLKNALVDPERYTLNLWTSTSKLALQQSAQDASVAEWINFTNDVLKTLHKFPWANGQKFGQAFAYINFSLIFDFPAWTKNDVPATLQSYAQVKQHPWIMDHLVNTELAQITYQDRGNVQQTKVINLDYHLLPGAWANATLRNRQWKQELTNANVPHANNKHAKKLRLLGRFMKYNRELQKGQTPLLDTVVNLIPTNRQACAKNFLKP